MNIVVLFFLLFFLALFVVSFVRDRSKYRNCYYLFFLLFFTINFLQAVDIVSISFVFGIVLIFILFLPFFLVANGVLMIKREGFGLSHILSLTLGLLIGFGEITTFFVVLVQGFLNYTKVNHLLIISRISMIFSVSIIYISITFAVFIIYCLFLQIIPKKKNFNYIIVHGSGLIDGNKVSKLLADRIDKAIKIYRKSSVPAKLILSGGQGNNEKISEAEAMKRYCIKKNIAKDDLVKVDKSTTTFENLENAKKITDNRDGDKNIVLVTSNYHVYRALRYCKKIKLRCNGVGSHVAFYYWPSAIIREYIAIHAEKKHLIILIIGWIMFMIPLILSFR